MRQKNQVELNLGSGATGETRSAAAQETEARAARTEVESRAAVGPSMEVIVERNNLKKALVTSAGQQGRRRHRRDVRRGPGTLPERTLAHDPGSAARRLLQTAAGAARRHTEGIGRHTRARHPDGARPLHPAGSDAGAASGLGPDVLRA